MKRLPAGHRAQARTAEVSARPPWSSSSGLGDTTAFDWMSAGEGGGTTARPSGARRRERERRDGRSRGGRSSRLAAAVGTKTRGEFLSI